MAACPKCGRALAPSAKTCVYCAHGNTYKPKEQLKIPQGTLPKRRKGLPWGWIMTVIAILAGVAVYYRPEFHDKINAFFKSLLSQF